MWGSVKLVRILLTATRVSHTQVANGKTISAGESPATTQRFETVSITLTLPMRTLLVLQQLAKSSRCSRRRRNVLWCAANEQTAVLALSQACVRGAARLEPALSLLATYTRSRLVGAKTGVPRKIAAPYARIFQRALPALLRLGVGGATLQ